MTRTGRARQQPLFTRATLRFLTELAANNERSWFEANRDRYDVHVLEPALALIEQMGPRLERLSERFVAIPKRSGGSLMRVYRDTRFSRDKTPYKTNIGIQFRHEQGKDVHAPGFYLHIEPRSCFVGAGIWHPESAALNEIRRHIAENGPQWRRATRGNRFSEVFAFGGATLIRPPRGFDPTSPDIDDIKRKDYIAVSPLPDGAVVGAGLPDTLAARLKLTKPLVAFLCDALGLPF